MTTTVRALLFDLITDVEQLVTAGAESAAGHERLRQHAQRLEKLRAQVPALCQFLTLIQSVISADKCDVPRELLQLLTQTRRLRASLAEPKGLSGDLHGVECRDEWQSEMTVPELIAQVGQISRSGPYRQSIRDGRVLPPKQDLRMVGQLLGWIEGRNHRLADSLIEDVIPKMGASMARELARERFDPEDIGDMNWLVALAKLDPDAALKSVESLDAELGAYLRSEPSVAAKPKRKR